MSKQQCDIPPKGLKMSGEGMDELEFAKAKSNINDLVSEDLDKEAIVDETVFDEENLRVGDVNDRDKWR